MPRPKPAWLTEEEPELDNLPAGTRRLYMALHAVTDAYWGVDSDHAGDGGEPPSMIVEARAALEFARSKPPSARTFAELNAGRLSVMGYRKSSAA